MNATRALHDLGQSLWLDNITRDLLDSGTLARYVRDLAVTGLTSNPTIFQNAIVHSKAYDEAIRIKSAKGLSGEALLFELIIEDLDRAAELFLPVFKASRGLDGWVSLEVSPMLALDAAKTIRAAADLHGRTGHPNFFMKIPGTAEGLVAIEESIFTGIPVNITLLFSRAHYLAAAKAYMRGIERRILANRDPNVDSVASLFVSRWDVAAKQAVPGVLNNRLGIAVATQAYLSYRALLASSHWQRVAAAGARPQRLLWASTGTKDPTASDTLYIEQLAASGTINTMPEKTLLAFADHGEVKEALTTGGDDAEKVIAEFGRHGLNCDALATQLQREGVDAFATSWQELLKVIDTKTKANPIARVP